MNKYRAGDQVICNTEIRANGRKYILAREPDEFSQLNHGTFQIACKNRDETYSVVVPEDFVGWTIDEFKVRYQKTAAPFKGKKFFDVKEEFILRKV